MIITHFTFVIILMITIFLDRKLRITHGGIVNFNLWLKKGEKKDYIQFYLTEIKRTYL